MARPFATRPLKHQVRVSSETFALLKYLSAISDQVMDDIIIKAIRKVHPKEIANYEQYQSEKDDV